MDDKKLEMIMDDLHNRFASLRSYLTALDLSEYPRTEMVRYLDNALLWAREALVNFYSDQKLIKNNSEEEMH